MRPYDRADSKARLAISEKREFREYYSATGDVFNFFHDPYEPNITMDDVRIGWLFSLLIKLGLRNPKEKIKGLRW